MSAPMALLAAVTAIALMLAVAGLFWAILAFCDEMLTHWREDA